MPRIKKPSPLNFPCTYPLKVIGRNVEGLEELVLRAAAKHIAGIGPEAIRSQKSQEAKYLAITLTFTAESREQVEAIYTELNHLEAVVMTL